MAAFITKEKLFSNRWFQAYGMIVLGSFILATGYALFIAPHEIVPGGVFGLAIVIHSFTDLPIGMTALAINIPIVIVGIRVLGRRFGWKTIVGFVLTSVFTDLIWYMTGGSGIAEGDTLLSTLFGGLFIGAGVGLVFKARASTGGTDVIAKVISRKTRIPVSQAIMPVDGFVVLLGAISFGNWTMPLYAIIAIFIIGKVIDVILQGVSYEKTLFIVSDYHQQIKDKILVDLNRGGTLIPAKGMYNQNEKQIIFTVVSRRELAILEEHILNIDPNAFMSVINANEIIGHGFKTLDAKLSKD
ncbi:MAG: YitT family protein [Bacteroidales bacterium]|nr:YitT family protein [Bacteroidales bacterium]